MNWNVTIRQAHRWVSMAFLVAVVILTGVAIAVEEPAEWVFFLPLPPLFVLMFSGLYLFILPYRSRGRGSQQAA